MKRGTMLGLYLKSSILPCETITGRMLLGGGVIKKLSAGRLLHDLKVSWNLHHVTSAKRDHICHVAKPYRLIMYTVVERKSWAILPYWDPYWSSWNDILPKKESK